MYVRKQKVISDFEIEFGLGPWNTNWQSICYYIFPCKLDGQRENVNASTIRFISQEISDNQLLLYMSLCINFSMMKING